MILTGLLWVVVITAIFQPNAPRLVASVSFVSITRAHEFFLSETTGIGYYGSAALFDLATMAVLRGINPVPKMVLSLQKICIVSIGLNLAGWILWMCYLPPTAYNLAFIGIMLWAIVVLTIRDESDVGGFTMDSWGACFRGYYRAMPNYFRNHRG